MKDAARARIRRARAALDHAEKQLAPPWQRWRQLLGRPPLSLLLGGGLLGGFVLAALPRRWWSRAGAAVFGGGAWLARSPFGPPIFAALWTTILLPSKRPASEAMQTGPAAP
jgi:hypothetical protein